MYGLSLSRGGFIRSAEIQRALAQLPFECGSELHSRRMQQLGAIEHLEARGCKYSNQDFDVLSSALNFIDAVAPDDANSLRDRAYDQMRRERWQGNDDGDYGGAVDSSGHVTSDADSGL